MYDSALYYRKKAIPSNRNTEFALASLHRAENTDDTRRLSSILSGMSNSPIPVILPLHPRTKKVIRQEGLEIRGQLEIMEPLSYLSMLGMVENCSFVITDSGGLQKEAYFFGKKCITVRDETEWTELVECGANRVVGSDESAIRAAFSWAMTPLSGSSEIYGKGDAGPRIVQILLETHR